MGVDAGLRWVREPDGADRVWGAQSTTISTPVNAATNQLSGYAYDANGNQISTGYGYDPENRIVSVNAGAVQYMYDAQNKRVWQGNVTSDRLVQTMTVQNILMLALLGAAVAFIGAAWVCTVLIHAKVVRSTALPHASLWKLWSEVAKAYPSVCPGGRLLLWRSIFLSAGLCAFVGMMATLVLTAIASRVR